jgi:hypothetical protein
MTRRARPTSEDFSAVLALASATRLGKVMENHLPNPALIQRHPKEAIFTLNLVLR